MKNQELIPSSVTEIKNILANKNTHKCTKNNLASHICVNQTCFCNNPFICTDQQCECLEVHQNCKQLRVKTFYKKIQENNKQQQFKEIKDKIMDFSDGLIDLISVQRDKMILSLENEIEKKNQQAKGQVKGQQQNIELKNETKNEDILNKKCQLNGFTISRIWNDISVSKQKQKQKRGQIIQKIKQMTQMFKKQAISGYYFQQISKILLQSINEKKYEIKQERPQQSENILKGTNEAIRLGIPSVNISSKTGMNIELLENLIQEKIVKFSEQQQSKQIQNN